MTKECGCPEWVKQCVHIDGEVALLLVYSETPVCPCPQTLDFYYGVYLGGDCWHDCPISKEPAHYAFRGALYTGNSEEKAVKAFKLARTRL